ncbi:hypothetical protein IMZ48_27450 [Candidatus Bathyarchaeota archaeon]|nr:hypothetical protein [Candidatus Bathyarchaeota archaeon]
MDPAITQILQQLANTQAQLAASQQQQQPHTINPSSIPKLKDEHSYDQWKGSLENYLETLGLLRYVQNDVPAPPEEGENKARWSHERGTAYQLLLDSSWGAADRLEQGGYSDKSRNPYLLWKAAESTFGQVDTLGGLDVLQKLGSLDRGAYRSTHQLLREFFFLRKRLASVETVSDRLLAMMLLNSVRNTHEGLFSKYKVREKVITLESVLADLNQLQIDENRNKEENQEGPQAAQHAFVGFDSNKIPGPRSFNNHKKGAPEKDPPPLCSWCEDYHWLAEGAYCWKVFPEHIPASHRNPEAAKKHAEAWLLTEKGKHLRAQAHKKLNIVDTRTVPQPPISPPIRSLFALNRDSTPDLTTGSPAPGYLPPSAW